MTEAVVKGQWIEAGLLLRGQLRRELTKAGVSFTETKTLTSSVFVIPRTADFNMVVRSLREQGLIS